MKISPPLREPQSLSHHPFHNRTTPLLMGVLNCTPDSFFDGGMYFDSPDAAAHAFKMIDDGADIIDIGGESTRPGAKPVPAREQMKRILPVIETIRRQNSAITLSVDTQSAGVARAAIAAGANIINDVSGLRKDSKMADVIGRHKAHVVIMHMQGEPHTMQSNPQYDNVVGDIKKFFLKQIKFATSCGIQGDRIIIDPGIGFGKTVEHNLDILRSLADFKSIGQPLMIGLSNKSFLGAVTGRQKDDRTIPSVICAIECARLGANIIRAHNIRAHRDAFNVLAALNKETIK